MKKKLKDALQKLHLHQKIKDSLEAELRKNNTDSIIIKEIEKQDDIIEIWKKNIEKIKKEREKLQK